MSPNLRSSILVNEPWQQALAHAITSPSELLKILDLDSALLLAAEQAARSFGLKVTRSFVDRMERGNPADPLLRQVLPLAQEMMPKSGYSRDPVGDLNAQIASGVLQKYRGRALLITTAVCAIHCRYCFRRSFPYQEHQLHHSQQAVALAAITADPTIHEVILSGGDPLLLNNSRLNQIIEAVAAIGHVKRLRIHSRIPLLLPERIDAGLVDALTSSRLQIVMVIHANHANEIDASVERAMAQLSAAAISLFNQSVLLRGVNDSVTALAALSEALFDVAVTPYYLFLLDKAVGTAHFDLPREEAIALFDALRQQLPGYMVPRLALEEAGAPYKTLL